MKGGGSLRSPIKVEADVAHQPLLGGRKLEGLPFMRYKNVAGRFFGLVTKHACVRQTDGRTDGQNYDSQDRASIAASRGKKRYRYTVALCQEYFNFVLSNDS